MTQQGQNAGLRDVPRAWERQQHPRVGPTLTAAQVQQQRANGAPASSAAELAAGGHDGSDGEGQLTDHTSAHEAGQGGRRGRQRRRGGGARSTPFGRGGRKGGHVRAAKRSEKGRSSAQRGGRARGRGGGRGRGGFGGNGAKRGGGGDGEGDTGAWQQHAPGPAATGDGALCVRGRALKLQKGEDSRRL